MAKKAFLRSLLDKARDAAKAVFGASEPAPLPSSSPDTSEGFEHFMERAERYGRRTKGVKRSDYPPGSRRERRRKKQARRRGLRQQFRGL